MHVLDIENLKHRPGESKDRIQLVRHLHTKVGDKVHGNSFDSWGKC